MCLLQFEKGEDDVGILKILSTIPEDQGNYTVKGINIHGEIEASVKLNVKPLTDHKKHEEFSQVQEEELIQPTFEQLFEDRRVLEGISTKFECIVTGKPPPKVISYTIQ